MNEQYIIRAKRKDDHIVQFLRHKPGLHNGFEDVVLQNNSLPELSFDAIDTSTVFLKRKIDFPLMLNATTGGTDYTKEINRELAQLAKQLKLPIAVGSQTVAADNPESAESFRVVRDICSDNIVIANVSAGSSEDRVKKAIEMVEADAVQLHLNAPQEMCMAEGDRSFAGILKNIEHIIKSIEIPLIVKETGFGMSYETACRLGEIGVEYIDISGKGGTDFIAIESSRNQSFDCSFLKNWGIPTALSLLECRQASGSIYIICSGGITNSEEIVKSLCMGADLTAMSGAVLRLLVNEGFDRALAYLEKLKNEVKIIMLLLGAASIEELRNIKYILKGEVKELFESKFKR
ncbi:MAG: type 2 isopentenyl-diphosphate Delta-isomerase [Bacillota bacterium]